MKNLLVLTMTILIAICELNAQINQQVFIGGGGIDNQTLAIKSGNFYYIGNATNSDDGDFIGNENSNKAFGLTKLDVNFNKVSSWCYGGVLDDHPYAITANDDEGVTMFGYTDMGVTSNRGVDMSIINLNSDGDTIWTRHFGGPGTDVGYTVNKTLDGYLLSGTSGTVGGDVTKFNGGIHDAWILKIDDNGNITKNIPIGGSGQEDFHKVIEVSDGYLFVGTTNSTDSVFKDVPFYGEYDGLIAKTDFDGNIIWIKKFGGEGQDYLFDVIKKGDLFYIVGTTSSTSINGIPSGLHGITDVLVIVIDSYGNLQNTHCYGGTGQDNGYAIAQTQAGSIVLGGSTKSNDGDVTGNYGSADTWIVTIDTSGSVTSKCYGGSAYDNGGTVALISDSGKLIVATYTESVNSGDIDGDHASGDAWVFCIGDLATNTNPIKLTSSLTVYPNPAFEKIYVHLSEPGVHTLVLSDISGTIINKFTIIGKKGEIERGNVASGMYFLNEIGRPGIIKILFK
jgi:hypothetical protein